MSKSRKTKDNKDTYIRARATKNEKELIKNYAELHGMTISDYIMSLIWADMEKE